jgi:hypothetical protein
MKQILVELDDRCAQDLERVAPAGARTRAAFIRGAIRRAIDLALDRETAVAYEQTPLDGEVSPDDLSGWDAGNLLRRTAARTQRNSKQRSSKRQ